MFEDDSAVDLHVSAITYKHEHWNLHLPLLENILKTVLISTFELWKIYSGFSKMLLSIYLRETIILAPVRQWK